MSLVVQNLSEQIFDVIRERIVSGRFSHSHAIRQDALANELGVSKVPLREALAKLEQAGLILSRANRGYFVRPMSKEEAEEVFALRLSIEPRAVAAAALAATDADREMARAALDALDSAASKDLSAVGARNRAFHMALVKPGRRPLTTQLVEKLQTFAERYVYTHLEPAGRGDRAHLEHQELLDAWLARDANRAAKLAKSHILGTLKDLRRQLDRNEEN